MSFGKIKDSAKKGIDIIKNSTQEGIDKIKEHQENKKLEEEKTAKIRLIPITKKFSDELCNESGYQFILSCDRCDYQYKTRYTESSAGTKGSTLKIIGKGANVGFDIAGKINAFKKEESEDKAGEKSDGFFSEWSNRFAKYGPAWQKDYAKAFDAAQDEAKEYFSQCPKCRLWVCESCWDPTRRLCNEDSKGLVLCHKCNHVSGGGKFCKNCGAPQKLSCPNCKIQLELDAKFCTECGHNLV